MGVVGNFGPVVFEVSSSKIRTWKSLSRSCKAKFVQHEVTENKPRLQRNGLDLQTVDLTIQLDARFINPEEELDRLQEVLEAQEALPLLLGSTHMGKFVLEQFDEQRSRTDGKGLIMFCEVSLKLKEYN